MNAKGEAVEPQEFGGGEAIWTDMPKYKEAGSGSYELINYEVKLTYVDKLDSNVYEDIEDYGYETNEIVDGYTYYFTSVHDSSRITVTAEKVWNDGLTERPFYTPWIIGLSLSGVDAEPTEVDTTTDPNKWVYTWEDLYRYDNSGETIEYTLTEENIPEGYEDGMFRPEQAVTRAEFAVIASKFAELTDTEENIFTDVPDDYWGAPYILLAHKNGWVDGYGDGTFKPLNSITRAEVVSTVNRMLERVCDKTFADRNTVKTYADTLKSHWAYYDITEASNGHLYTKDPDEVWSEIVR